MRDCTVDGQTAPQKKAGVDAGFFLNRPSGQSSIKKLRSCSLRLGWRSLRSALASI